MSLYRASPADGCAWITGGSSGIGRSVALQLARRGYKVAISARNFDHFDAIAPDFPDECARITKFPCDVTDPQQMAATLEAITRQLGPVCLALLNAGTYTPQRGDQIALDVFRRTFEVNVMGVLHGMVPLVDHMKANGRGQIAITASVTSYAGLPTAAAYGSTKAYLNSMAESLKFDLDRVNIRLQIVNPGFVVSELTRKNDFPMPGIIKTKLAAQRLVTGLERGGFEIRFPKRVAWPLKLARLLPYPLYFKLMAKITGADKPL